LLFAGCRDAGIGGTGEMVVPRETLRDIEGADPGKFAVAPATTVPSTQPSTRASTQPLKDVQLTLEEVRQLALQNNLDLKVDALPPAISKQNLSANEAEFESLSPTSIDYSTFDTPTATSSKGRREQLSASRPACACRCARAARSTGAPFSRSETDNQFRTLNPRTTRTSPRR
jgi:hypothetical protein